MNATSKLQEQHCYNLKLKKGLSGVWWCQKPTSKDVTEMPFISMEIFSHQFLPWWILSHILKIKTIPLNKSCHRCYTQTTYTKYCANQLGQTFFSMSPEDRETTMGARVWSSQSLAEGMDIAPFWLWWLRIWASGLILLIKWIQGK